MGISSTTGQNDIRLLIPTSARTVLVVGCGDGSLGAALKRDRQVEVSGIEMSPAATKARVVLDRVYSGTVESVAEKLPPGYFDCVIFEEVLERLTNPHRALTLLKKCLKQQGTVVVAARNARYWPVLKSLLEDGFQGRAEGRAEGGAGGGAESRAEDRAEGRAEGQSGSRTSVSPPEPVEQERLRLLSKAAVVGLLRSVGFEVSILRPLRDEGEEGMPEALRVAVERELGANGAALAEETQDRGYVLVARLASAVEASERALMVGAAGERPATTQGTKPSETAQGDELVGGSRQGPAPAGPSSVPALPAAPRLGSPGMAGTPKGTQVEPPPKRKPIASIVVLTWNQKELTERLLRSLETTTKVPHEVIVVDNGSQDDTAGFLAAYAAARAAESQDMRVIVNAENLGIAKGFNQGLKVAKGDYLILLHNDVILPAQWLERMIRHFRADRKIGLVGPRSNVAKSHQSAPIGYRDLGEFPAFAETFFNRYQGNRTKVDTLGGFCLAVRREVLAKTGLFDETYEVARYEDDDLCMRARFAGYQLVVADDILVHHLGSASFKRNEADPFPMAEVNRGKFIDRWSLKPSIVYILRWAAQSAAAQAVFRQVNDLADQGYEVRMILLEGKTELIDVRAQVNRVGAFEMLPQLDEDIVVVCSALDLPIIAPKCRGKLVHLCLGYESFAYGTTADDVAAEKPQIERYHSVPCARIVASNHLRDLFERKFSQKTLVVPGWLDPVLGVPRQTVWPGVVESANVLFVGRPNVPKGLADFTAAVRAVRKKYPGVTMHLAVPPRTIASQEKAEAMFEGPMTLHAGMSRTEMESLYRMVDVAVFPSWYEGSSMHVLEAMACGAPVITSDSLGIHDVCVDGENALIVPPGYPRKLAQALTRIIEDESLRQRLAVEGPKVAARYTREESVKALQQAIDTIFRWEAIPSDFRPAPHEIGMRVTQGLTSIVIATYNALEFTKKCLDSIFAFADSDPFELIVVDNGSTDGTWPFLEDLARRRKNVRALRNPYNMGLSYAIDQGIFVSAGEFVVMLHSDTIVTRGWLRRLKRIASAVPGAGLVGPVSNNVTGQQLVDVGDLRTMDQIQGCAGGMAVRLAGQTTEVNRLSSFCLMAKRELLDRIGVLDITFHSSGFEDDDLSVRARMAGLKCVIAQDVFIYHFRGRTFADNTLDRMRLMERNRHRFLRKWVALLQASGSPDAKLWEVDEAKSAPPTGAERLARRIAERAGSAEAGDEGAEYLPPEELGPVPATPKPEPSPSPVGGPGRISRRDREAAPPDGAPSDETATDGDDLGVSSMSPADVDALHAKAEAQLQSAHFIIALAMFERILKVRPLDARARRNAALCAIQTGDVRKARRYLNSLISHPEALGSGKDSDVAGSAQSGGTSSQPTLPGIYNLFGVSFLVEQDFPAAATCFEKALAIDPAYGEAMENLSVAREKMSRG